MMNGMPALDSCNPFTEAVQRLRILLITQDDPIYVFEFFKTFFSELPKDELEIVGLTIGLAFHEPLRRTLRRMINFYGWTGAVRLGVRFLNAKLRGRSIKTLARRHGVPLVATASVNAPAYLDRIRALRPDVILSVAAAEIFCPNLLSLPTLGCMNIHSGRLPKYRGMLPTFWQMLNGEPEVTITVHRMVEKLDVGDVLATATFPIRRPDSLDRVIRGTKRAGAQLFIRVLRELRTGRARPVPLDMTQRAYFRFPAQDDARAFRQRGHRLL